MLSPYCRPGNAATYDRLNSCRCMRSQILGFHGQYMLSTRSSDSAWHSRQVCCAAQAQTRIAQDTTVSHGMVQSRDSTAWHSTMQQRSIAWHSTPPHGIAKHSTVKERTAAWHYTQHDTARYASVQHSRRRHLSLGQGCLLRHSSMSLASAWAAPRWKGS